MSIDVKEWAVSSYEDAVAFSRNLAALEASDDAKEIAEHEFAVKQIFQMIRAVIADEAAKAQPAEPRAEVDVPKLPCVEDEIEKSIRWLFPLASAATVAEAIRYVMSHRWSATEAAESEFTRRVAEATAELQAKFDTQTKCDQKRIAELEKQLAECDNWRELSQAIVLKMVKAGFPLNRSKDTALDGIDQMIQQLSTATAEVERLSNYLIDTGEVIAKHGDGGDVTIDAPHLAREAEAVIVKLRQQLAEATRPVENTAIYTASHVAGHTQVVLLDDFCRERAARVAAEQRAAEAEKDYAELDRKNSEESLLLDRAVQMRKDAEAERDELREAWKRRFACVETDGNGSSRWSTELRDSPTLPEGDPSDAVLAAFRAEKGKVQA